MNDTKQAQAKCCKSSGCHCCDAFCTQRPGGQVGIALTAQSEASEARLSEESKVLRTQLEAAGLNLTELQVAHGQAAE